MSNSVGPRLLFVLPEHLMRDEWRSALCGGFDVVVASDVAAAKELATQREPDIFVVDIGLETTAGESAVVVLRGLFGSSEFVGMGRAIEVETLLSVVNEGNIRRFLSFDVPAKELVDCIAGIISASRSAKTLRERLREVTQERDILLRERENLTQQLTFNEEALRSSTGEQEEARARLESAFRLDAAPSNCLSLSRLRVRLSEEMEKHARYEHPLSLLLVTFSREPGTGDALFKQVNADLQTLLANAVRHIDLVAMDGPGKILVLLPVTTADRAKVVSQRVLGAVRDANLPVRDVETQVWDYPTAREQFLRLS